MAGAWPAARSTSSSRCCSKGHRADPRARGARPAWTHHAHAARVGARPLAAAAQRVPPLHRRPSPVGGHGERRRARRHRRAARPARARCAVPRPRQGVPGRSHRGRHGPGARDRPAARTAAEPTSTCSSRWSSTTCCCPTSPCAATSPIRRRSSSSPTRGRLGDVLDLLHALTDADSMATGPSAWGRWKEELVADLVARVRHVLGGGDVHDATWTLFPDAETLGAMAHRANSTSCARDDAHHRRVAPTRPDRSAGSPACCRCTASTCSRRGRTPTSARPIGRVAVPGVVPRRGHRLGAGAADLARALPGELAIEARLAERARTYRRRRALQAAKPGRRRASSRRGVERRDRARGALPNHIGILHRITKALPRSASTSATPPCRRSGWRSSTRSTCTAQRRVRLITTSSTAPRSSGPSSTPSPDGVLSLSVTAGERGPRP